MTSIVRVTAIAAGISATAVAVLSAISGSWDVAIWALLAAAAWMLLIAHRCPRTAAERGYVAISFTGGPLDGADIPIPQLGLPELLGADLEVRGTTYRVNDVAHTCYTAEVETSRRSR